LSDFIPLVTYKTIGFGGWVAVLILLAALV
jgi:hypothetical protein